MRFFSSRYHALQFFSVKIAVSTSGPEEIIKYAAVIQELAMGCMVGVKADEDDAILLDFSRGVVG